MHRPNFKIFFSLLITLAVICAGIIPSFASADTVPDSTPAAIEPTSSQDSTADASPETPSAAVSPAPGSTSPTQSTPKPAIDGEPDSTGNSGGQIAFMLIIFLVCLFFIVEAIVHWLRKKKDVYVNPEDDWRRR